MRQFASFVLWTSMIVRQASVLEGFQFFGQRTFAPFMMANPGPLAPLFPRLVTTNQINEIVSRVEVLEKIANESSRGCPPTAKNAKIIRDFCYSLSAPENYEGAKLKCFQNGGGRLAEPNFDDEEFVNIISDAFPDEIARASTGIIIGATSVAKGSGEETTYVFQYESNGIQIPERDNVEQTTEENLVAIIKLPEKEGDPWTIESDSFEQNHSYLCQYNII